MRSMISRFMQDQAGATAIEYALIAAGIAVVIVAAVNAVGSTLNTIFTKVNSNLSAS